MRGLTLWHTSDSIAQEDDGGAGAAPKAKGMFSAFTNLVSGKILDEDDLDPVLRTVKESLIAKNVAVDIAGECARAQRFPYSLRKSKSKKAKAKAKAKARAQKPRGISVTHAICTDKLCESISTSLVGKRCDGWTGVKATVKKALEEALTRILTPKQSINVVREIHDVREREVRDSAMRASHM